MILMVPVAVKILEVVEGMVLMDPWSDDDARINLAIQVFETVKSRSNLMGDNPLEMMCCSDLSNCSKMKMRVVDHASLWIWCSLMKPD
jgi:hypothetical protein